MSIFWTVSLRTESVSNWSKDVHSPKSTFLPLLRWSSSEDAHELWFICTIYAQKQRRKLHSVPGGKQWDRVSGKQVSKQMHAHIHLRSPMAGSPSPSAFQECIFHAMHAISSMLLLLVCIPGSFIAGVKLLWRSIYVLINCLWICSFNMVPSVHKQSITVSLKSHFPMQKAQGPSAKALLTAAKANIMQSCNTAALEEVIPLKRQWRQESPRHIPPETHANTHCGMPWRSLLRIAQWEPSREENETRD